MKANERIIVPLDVDKVEKAINLADQLAPHVGQFKIGLELINSMLASIIVPKNADEAACNLDDIRELFELLEGKIFWDGKFSDIPNTVAGASASVVKMNVKMFNVHVLAGKEAIVKAVENKGNSKVLGVTVLTSIDKDGCRSIFGDEPGIKVVQFAAMLVDAKADGIICSPQELAILGQHPELDNLLKVTPGVRPAWASKGDQKRVMTPRDAILAGADYLVIGRPITQPPEEIGTPIDAVDEITEEIEKAAEEM